MQHYGSRPMCSSSEESEDNEGAALVKPKQQSLEIEVAPKAAAEHEFKQARAAFDVLQAPYRAAARQARAGPAWKLGGGVPLGVNLGSRFFIMFCLLCAAERERWQQNARRASGAR